MLFVIFVSHYFYTVMLLVNNCKYLVSQHHFWLIGNVP